MNGHTPGPWAVLDWSVIAKGASVVVADMSPGTRLQANARLIAAAPDLLDALGAMLATHSSDEHAQNVDGWMDARQRAVKAIAKAEGSA